MTRAPVTRPGRHGTLYLYEFAYTADPGIHRGTWRTYAYDADHAIDRWHDTNDGDYEVLSGPTLVRRSAA